MTTRTRAVVLASTVAGVLAAGVVARSAGTNECTTIPGVTCRGDRVERPTNTHSVVLTGRAEATFPAFSVTATQIQLAHAPGRPVLVMAEGDVTLRHAGETLSFRSLTFESAAGDQARP